MAIACALVNDPPLVLADEPAGAVASRRTEEILPLFPPPDAEEGITIVMTHDTKVARHAKRMIRTKNGRIQDDRTHQPVLSPSRNGPAHPGAEATPAAEAATGSYCSPPEGEVRI